MAGNRKAFKANPATRRAYRIAFLIPVLAAVFLSVLLPLLSDPWEESGDPVPSVQARIAASIAEGFLENCLTLSRSDSLCLIVDLVDSLAWISIRGVPVREFPVTRIRLSPAVAGGIRSGSAVRWISGPFAGQKTWSTISRTILHVKKAPRDTLEARRNLREPRIPVEKADVYLIMEYDRNLVLEIMQTERAGLPGILRRELIRSGHHLTRSWRETRRLFSGRLPRHALWIRIGIGRDDARALRRALPKRPGLAVRLPAQEDPGKE
ncbi:MAG TPA: hypothetical protein ENN17_09890 [bacterium]|nr:hypothetical protein [bacterium]